MAKDFTLIAGPCAVESEDQIVEIAKFAKAYGANILRGGIYKPRTYPYSFQGVKEKGFRYLATAKKETGLPVVSEIVDINDLEKMYPYCDMFQIGTRNAQNYALLKEVGRTEKPVLLKRGFASTIYEWLGCAEYILMEGNQNLVLCERGIRTFENYTRNTMDLSAISALKTLSHVPVIADPSHGTGRSELVYPMSMSSIMAGCDGLMLEIHLVPERSVCDANQTISLEAFRKLAGDAVKLWKFKQNELKDLNTEAITEL